MRNFGAIALVILFSIGIASAQIALSSLKRRAQFNASSFVYNLANSTPTAIGLGGTGRFLAVDQFPVLDRLGVAFVLVHIKPCGINLAHVHPRGSELFLVLQGTFKTAFVEENTGRTIVNTLTAGQATVFPQGLIHEEQNNDCDTAIFLSSFSSEDPGVATTSTGLFSIPVEAVAATFGIKNDTVLNVKNSLPKNPAPGNQECLARCASLGSPAPKFNPIFNKTF